MEYYDIHTHLNHEPLFGKIDEINQRCKEKKIILNNIGTNLKTSQIAIDLAKQNDNFYACVGIHPNDTDQIDIDIAKQQIIKWVQESKTNKIVAIGETGLDYHYMHDRQKQLDFLKMHIEIAKQFNMPLMLHVRDAHEDMINILQTVHKEKQDLKFIIHCFSGNIYQAKQYINLNCYISIPGTVTFKNNNAIMEVIKNIPIEKILSETDAPWLAPVPFRGKINSPENINYIVEAIGKILNKTNNEIKKQLFVNACSIFKV